MRTLKLTILGSLGMFCMALALQNALAEDKAPVGALRVVVKAVTVSPTNADGKAWDVNDGKPDIMVSVKNLDDTKQKEFVTDAHDDAYETTFDSKTVLVSAGQKLQITVEDKDVAANDLIGRGRIDVTAEMLKKGSHTISFGQVKSLTLAFEKP